MASKLKLSKHSKTRMKERSGITENCTGKMARRALVHGIRVEDTMGELRLWIGNRRLNRFTNLYIYAGMAYIFSNNTLVTTIKLPEEIKDNMAACVEETAWVRYQKHREGLHKKKDEPKPYLRYGLNIDRKTVKVMVNRFFKENNIPFLATNVVQKGNFFTYEVKFVSNNPETDGQYMRSIREWGEKERNIKLVLKHSKKCDGSYLLKEEYLQSEAK